MMIHLIVLKSYGEKQTMSKLEPIIRLRLIKCRDCKYNKRCPRLSDILIETNHAIAFWTVIQLTKLKIPKKEVKR